MVSGIIVDPEVLEKDSQKAYAEDFMFITSTRM